MSERVAPHLGTTRAIDILAFATAAILPFLVVYKALDPFRQPKLLLLHGAGIALIGIMTAGAILGAIDWRSIVARRLPDLVLAAILGWSVICAVFAVHRRSAMFGVLTAVSAAALFLALRRGARRYGIWAALPIVVAGAVNGVLATVQELNIWNELVPLDQRGIHAGTTALIGNPNDVGSFLVPCFIAALAWLLASRSIAVRVLLGGALLAIGSGIFYSRTRGAMLGVAAGVAAMAVVRWRRAAALRLVALAIIAALALATYQPIVDRLFATEIEALASGRIVAFAAAWAMFTDAPVFGVGPGCFAYAYFDYASKVYPSMLEYAIAGKQFIFGEAHNDHLQILAETGLIGYLLFVAALGSLGAMSWKPVAGSERTRFARLAAAPLAVALFALALFQFPLYLAAPVTAFVFVAALAAGWSEDDEPVTA